jgi:hypothetical protein
MQTISEYIAKNYHKDDTIEGARKIDSMLARPGIYYLGSPHEGVILVYMLLSDEGLELLRSYKKQSEFTVALSNKMLEYPGDNVYVFRLVSESKVPLLTLRRLRSQIMQKHNAKSFSWHDNNHDNPVILHTYRG